MKPYLYTLTVLVLGLMITFVSPGNFLCGKAYETTSPTGAAEDECADLKERLQRLEPKNPLDINDPPFYKDPLPSEIVLVLEVIEKGAVSGIGTVKIPLKEIVSILRGYGNPTYGIILLRIRLPRIIQSAVVGIGLSVSGAFFQGLLANPLADPYILGASSGAALGATLSITLGLGLVGTEILAFATALATIYLVISLSKIGPRTFAVTMLLAGIAVSTFLSSIISFMMLLSDHKLANIVFWMMGGFNLISWKEVLISTPVIIGGTFFMYLFARDLNAIAQSVFAD